MEVEEEHVLSIRNTLRKRRKISLQQEVVVLLLKSFIQQYMERMNAVDSLVYQQDN